MREIKFRAWDKYQRKMYSWSKIGGSSSEGHLSLWNLINSLSDSLIVMQYTGLKDKNGKEIYEGDVIQNLNCFNCHSSWGDTTDNFPNERVVVFGDSGTPCFRLAFIEENIRDRGTSGLVFCKGNEKNFEIIGNIHENPELVEVKI